MREITIISPSAEWKTKSLIYSGGELRVEIPEFKAPDSSIDLICRIQSSDDLIRLLLAYEILNRLKVEINSITIPYFPYARQDRVTEENNSFSLETVCSILRSLKAEHIIVYDLHSQVPHKYLHNLLDVSQLQVIRQNTALNNFIIFNQKNCAIVAPDKGALEKSNAVAELYGVPLIVCEKKRDVATGKLSSPTILNHGYVEGRDLLIVDDICDGGGTFIQLADELNKYGPKSLSLYVTHGIFSKGLARIAGLFSRVFTTDSFIGEAHRQKFDGPFFNVHELNLRSKPCV
jgi:ribose-phosphate pyrophosphokinase